jgi:hypothetical protein
VIFPRRILLAPILVDSSEQLKLPFKEVDPGVAIEVVSLAEGDYTIRGAEQRIRIERKSWVDLRNTLLGGHLRFDKELSRLKPYDRAEVVIEDASSVENVCWLAGFDAARARSFWLMIESLELNGRIRFRFKSTRREAATYVLWALRSTLEDLGEAPLERCRQISEAMSGDDIASRAHLREVVLAEMYGICWQCGQRPGPRPKAPGEGICRCGRSIPKAKSI